MLSTVVLPEIREFSCNIESHKLIHTTLKRHPNKRVYGTFPTLFNLQIPHIIKVSILLLWLLIVTKSIVTT